MRKILPALCILWMGTTDSLEAQSLDREIAGLASRVNSALVSKGFKNVAAVDFTDLQGRPTELGRQLSERLVVELVLTAGVSVMDRANIRSILAEHRLTEEGLVNPATAKRLGEFAGVDAILTGTVSEVDAGWELLVKAISTESARIVAAGRITFPKTSDNQDAGSRGVAAHSGASTPTPTASNEQGRVSADRLVPIESADFGPLRVVIKSVNVIEVRGYAGVRVTAEFSNRDTRRPILVAMNAENDASYYQSAPLLRASAVADGGAVLRVSSTSLAGLGFVRAGVRGLHGGERYGPSDIVKLLRLRDQLGRDDNDPSDVVANGAGTYRGYNAPGSVPQAAPSLGNRFISGSTSSVQPGQSITATMDFVSSSGGRAAPSWVELTVELVVGLEAAAGGRTYSLQNLALGRIDLPESAVRK